MVVCVMVLLSACTAKPKVETKNLPPPPSSQGGAANGSESESDELSEDLSDIIGGIQGQLGEAPDNVIGFGVGFQKNSPILGSENQALKILYERNANIFNVYDMGCAQVPLGENMLAGTQGEDGAAAGYNQDGTMWRGKAGFTAYDQFGNLDAMVGQTSYTIASNDKTVSKASTGEAQAIVERASVYAYWIVSLPKGNELSGFVYNKGTDDRQEPVKKGKLHFLRIGPNPSETDVTVVIDSEGHYESIDELTAGHYKVSFDGLDGKGERVINENWLYIPGVDFNTDWFVLINTTYHIIYDSVTISQDQRYTVHMEWKDIPIDWKVASEEAYQYGTDAGFMGTYCLTYDYFQAASQSVIEESENTEDDLESELTPGYLPIIYDETQITNGGQTLRMKYKPTLSFYRGAKESGFIQDAYYVDMYYELEVVAGDIKMDVPNFPGAAIVPLEESVEKQLEPQFKELARSGRLDDAKVSDLIEKGSPLEISYTWPSGDYIKMVIQVQE